MKRVRVMGTGNANPCLVLIRLDKDISYLRYPRRCISITKDRPDYGVAIARHHCNTPQYPQSDLFGLAWRLTSNSLSTINGKITKNYGHTRVMLHITRTSMKEKLLSQNTNPTSIPHRS